MDITRSMFSITCIQIRNNMLITLFHQNVFYKATKKMLREESPHLKCHTNEAQILPNNWNDIIMKRIAFHLLTVTKQSISYSQTQ